MASKRTHDEAFVGPADDAAPQARLPRATQEIVTYFEELKSHFDGLDDKEEQALLVANALEEASGQECAVATDPSCSRVLEALLPAAEPQQIAKFFRAVLKDEGLMAMASSPFGAHVLEAVLEQLTNAQQDSIAEGTAIEELLAQACSNVCEHLYDFLTNRYATHVARRLLCIIAGRNVLPLAAKSQNKKSKGGALASKVLLLPGKQAATPHVAYPDLLHMLVDTLLSTDYISALHELMYDQNASPFIQGILTACEGNGEALQALIPAMLGAQSDAEEGDDSLLQGITRSSFQSIMQDRLSSHVVEVVFGVAPQPLLEEFYSSFLSGNLPALAAHPSANFALQAFLAAANRSPLVKMLLAELKGSFKELLQRRRSGVVAALLAACARTSAGQADASKAIAAALAGLHDEGKGLAETLLTLDMPGRICGPDMKPGQRVRLSSLGCAMLTTLLSFPQEFSQAFVSSIGDWSPSETLRVGQDPGGSRVLEALVNAAAASKAKKKLLRKLKGMWAILAVEPGGNHVVESCFIWGGVKDKEVIAGELAAAEASLSATPRGAALMRKCGTSAFKSSSSDWKRKTASDAQTLNEYAELFGSDQAAATKPSQAGHPASNGDVAHSHKDVAASEAAIMSDMNNPEQPAKKRKKGSKSIAAVAETDPAVVTDQLVSPEERQAVVKDKRNKKQAKRQEEEDLAEFASMLGTDVADAPWANEVVPTVPNTEGVGEPDDAAVKKKQKKSKRKESENDKGIQKQDVRVTNPQGVKEALALLGFAAAQPASKQKTKKAAKKV